MIPSKSEANASCVTFTHLKGEVSTFSSAFHSYYEIYFFIDGDVDFVCASAKRKLRPMDIIVIPAGEYHRFIVHSDKENYERCVLKVDASLISQAFLEKAFEDKRILCLDNDHRIIRHLLYLMQANATLAAEDFAVILPAVATDIILLIKQLNDFPRFEESGLHRLSVSIMKYINENYGQRLTLTKIADAFFVSVSTACHYFKDDFGISIKQYIVEKRMNEAKTLVEKGYKAQDICEELGFENYSSYFRAYRKHFGRSPSGKK